MHTSVIWAHLRRTATGIALCLGLTAAASTPATAAVLYDFSLAANGDVGPVRIVLSYPSFVPSGLLDVIPLSDPRVVTATSGTPIDTTTSVAGFEVGPTATLFGLRLLGPAGGEVLVNPSYPADFFVFNRTPTQTGTFQSTSGLVRSSLAIETRAPVATLVVRDDSAPVPEPATIVFLGAAALGAVVRRRRHAR
jgi:PEP-CTERM motif